ncbi:DEAD/DEAH box helicase [Halothermothrix orenii]|uniref:DEAD/DEAH box helicase domain protein n=1 Tax=Halothermothrix orenii (strain H 168 / OCM 544 / DSM 9562) TaxID=373903 RepID=B8CY43_HALOH|nr:DEAD/DEAH box helicase [Halothermothrix orenii]ACL70212.1 DEAD/DEAH box helicase domain protein [Halothermothrix orenii H 168]
MNLSQIKDYLKNSDKYKNLITYWKHIPPKEAEFVDFPGELDPGLAGVLREKGITSLYSHQAESYRAIKDGNHTVIVTPTASGKTLCYNLPVLDDILKDKSNRALYLFPTKALSQDQLAELYDLISRLDEGIKTYTYDGDTQVQARKNIRQSGHIVITNPDMLHTGILPHHTKWIKLFENLKYVVIDEIHTYRGVFGSHVANVIRRLKRICKFYGSDPVFICSSATIANPREFAGKLIGDKVHLIDKNGAPRGPRDFIFFNPPVINRELGIRRSYVLECKSFGKLFLENDIKTIVFARSRLVTEVILSYLKEHFKGRKEIRGYRGGYLPGERREIEKGLREGDILGVVSTNALELGIDIGQLDVCIMGGYPGTIASTWQQAGRAGRRNGHSLAVLIASSSPLDQFIVNQPEYFFEQPPENALINPDNLYILVSHIKCAAFELPFEDGETFGVETTDEILAYLEEEKILRYRNGKWYWMAERYPAEDISLRSASPHDFAVIDATRQSKPRVIGKVDHFSALTTIHKDAIYLHEGKQYQVKELDYDGKKAYVKQVNVNYYTDASLAVDLRVLDEFDNKECQGLRIEHGEVVVSAKATMFKKVKFNTHENVGYGDINLPEVEMHTTSYWFSFPGYLEERFGRKELESGLLGLSNLLVNIAPIYLMCDPGDIKSTVQVKSPYTGRPTIFVYDSYPGGVGMSEKLFRIHEKVLGTALKQLEECPCSGGCPGCVGPVNEIGLQGKDYTRVLLKEALGR